jgi:hypothetical protein
MVIALRVSSTIGLAREKYLDHKERKASVAAQGPSELHSQDGRLVDEDEDWALDSNIEPPAYESTEEIRASSLEKTVGELVQDVAASEHCPTQRPERLPYPIVIPQRRPGTKSRGFARAYPPDLARFDIDQEAFLRFLKSFHSASQASPALQALSITAAATSPIHGTITLAVSLSVQIALRYALP